MLNKIGRLAVCGAGRIGRIHKSTSRGFFGIGIDARPWFSRTPRLINRFDARQLEKTLLAEDITALPIKREPVDTIPTAT